MGEAHGNAVVMMARRARCLWAYRSTGRAVYGYLRGMTRDAHRAEDLLQETFLRLLRNGAPYGRGVLKPWLFKVAHNLAVDELRESARAAAPLTADVADTGDGPAQAAERSEAFERVREAARSLPAAQREVLVLRFASGLKFREIAEVTEAPLGTVLARARRGLLRLHGELSTEAEA